MTTAFLVSIFVVAVAEIGDKTQLLSLLLAARFRRPVPIIAGIAVATLANHAAAAWVGERVRALLGPDALRWAVALLAAVAPNHFTLRLGRPFPPQVLLEFLGEGPELPWLRTFTFRWPPRMGRHHRDGPTVGLPDDFWLRRLPPRRTHRLDLPPEVLSLIRQTITETLVTTLIDHRKDVISALERVDRELQVSETRADGPRRRSASDPIAAVLARIVEAVEQHEASEGSAGTSL